MKRYLPIIAAIILLSSCSKVEDTATSGIPGPVAEATSEAGSQAKTVPGPSTEINATTVTNAKILELKVKEFRIGTGFDASTRKIEGEAERFKSSLGKLWVYTIITGASNETFVRHVYYYKSKQIADVKLDVKFPVFSTWSYKTILPEWTGEWTVKVIDYDGRVIGEKFITIE